MLIVGIAIALLGVYLAAFVLGATTKHADRRVQDLRGYPASSTDLPSTRPGDDAVDGERP